jgi:hypothetical protein
MKDDNNFDWSMHYFVTKHQYSILARRNKLTITRGL